MPFESEEDLLTTPEREEKELCLNCMAPNDPSAHFCSKCGAPLSSYAATGPFESIFAECHLYRQAAEKPGKLIVLIGMWLLFGMIATAGGMMFLIGLLFGDGISMENLMLGAFFVPVSLVLVWKTTRNYLVQRRKAETLDRV